MPDDLLFIRKNRHGKPVDTCRGSSEGEYHQLYQVERMARTMQPGDTIECHDRELTREDMEEIRAKNRREADKRELENAQDIIARHLASVDADKAEEFKAALQKAIDQHSPVAPEKASAPPDMPF